MRDRQRDLRAVGGDTAVLDAFHVVKLGLQAMEETRRRVQQELLGHRGQEGVREPLAAEPRKQIMAVRLIERASSGPVQRPVASAREPNHTRGARRIDPE